MQTPSFDKHSRQDLINRIVELETLIFTERDMVDDYPDHLTPTQKAILGLLYSAAPRFVSTAFFVDTLGSGKETWVNSFKAQICYLRATLARRGIFIESAYAKGYSLDEANKAKLEATLAERKALRVRSNNRPICAARPSDPQPMKGTY